MGYRPGDLRPTGRGQEVAVVAPTHCRNGHPLGPWKVLVGDVLCEQDGVYRRHLKWICRECGDVIVGNGHPDACGQAVSSRTGR
jgi:hypothetical protein